MPSGVGSVEAIWRAVAWEFAVDKAELESRRTPRHVTTARMVSMALARRLTRMSFAQIGRIFGGRCHTTVLRDCRRVDAYMAAAEEALPPTATVEQWARCMASLLELPQREEASTARGGVTLACHSET